MKYLMYLIKEPEASWDDHCSYKLCSEKPQDWENYKRVLVEIIETADGLDTLFEGR